MHSIGITREGWCRPSVRADA